MTFQRSGAAARRCRSSASLVSSTAFFALLSAALSLHTACKADGYELGAGTGDNGDGDGGTGNGDGGTGDGDGGTGDIDAGGGGDIDAGPTCTNGVDDDCDGEDDDCDGNFDEDIDLTSDEAHCGACDIQCVAPHSI